MKSMDDLLHSKKLCPRLIDYLAIVGVKNPSKDYSVQTPELLQKYPPNDHKDFSFPLDMVYFCQPEGSISLGTRKSASREIQSFVFTLTDKDSGKTRFGICVNFYRPVLRFISSSLAKRERGKKFRRQSWQLNLNKSTDSAISSDQKSAINYSDSEKEQQSLPGVCTKASNSSSLLLSYSLINNEIQRKNSLTSLKGIRGRQRIQNHSLTSLCFISHHPFFSLFRDCLLTLKKIIDCCNDNASLKRSNSSHAYSRNNIWSILTSGNSDNNSFIMHDVKEIETWILRLLSVPVPVPGKTQVLVELLSPDLKTPLTFALPDHTRFSLIDFPLHLPLELLGINLYLKLVLQSRDYNALSMCVIAFVTLIYPLQYMFPVIPLLPTCLHSAEQLLLAPTPFIIGIPASFFLCKKNFRLPDDIWIVDLDSNRIIPPLHQETVPPLPEPETTILKKNLKMALDSLSPTKEVNKNSDSHISSQELTNVSNDADASFIYGHDIDSIDIATRVAMVRFFNSPDMLANFMEHTRTLRLYPRPVVAVQVNSFLRSRSKLTSFITQFSRTQAIEYLAEWWLIPSNMAFLRIHTGISDPCQIGDKPKWYSHLLEPLTFRIMVDNFHLTYILRNSLKKENQFTDESGSDTDEDSSRSSSYSSLSDFVSELMSSEFSTVHLDNTQKLTSSGLDIHSIYNPPNTLQIPGIYSPNSPVSISESLSSSSHSEYSSTEGNNDDQTLPLNNKELVEMTKTSADSETCVYTQKLNPSSSIEKKSFVASDSSTPHFSVDSEEILSNHSTPVNKIVTSISSFGSIGSLTEALSCSKTSVGMMLGKASNLTEKTITIGEKMPFLEHVSNQVKEKAKERLKQSSQEGLKNKMDKFTIHARKAAEEASKSAREVSRSAFEVSKHAAEAGMITLDELTTVGKNTFEDLTKSARETAFKTGLLKNLGEVQESSMHVSSEFSDTDTSHLKQDSHHMKTNLKLQDQVHPFGPFFTGKMGSIEKSQLIQHADKSEKSQSARSSAVSAASVTSTNENHLFLCEAVNNVLEGNGLGWLKLNRFRKLMEDENYRNYVLKRLNMINDKKIAPDDHVDDICIQHAVWKGMSRMLQAVIHGLECTYSNYSLGGIASAYLLLEICHTHYWSKEPEEYYSSDSFVSENFSPFGSSDNFVGSANSESDGGSRSSSKSFGGISDVYLLRNKDKGQVKNLVDQSAVGVLKDLLIHKHQKLLAKLRNVGSEESKCYDMETSSDHGGFVTNSVLITDLHPVNSCNISRSAISDSELDHRNTLKLSINNRKSLTSSLHFMDQGFLNTCPSPECSRTYLYEGFVQKERSLLWNQMQFWEDMFLDCVCQERDMVGMDQGPTEMMERYNLLNEIERKRLEHDEDRLLSSLLYNLVAFMVTMNVKRGDIKVKIRRLLAKSHIGLVHSQEVTELLERVDYLVGNSIDLKPLPSRHISHQSFAVHTGTDKSGELRFLEVRDDGFILRCPDGTIVERWWFERVINMTYNPKNHVLCLWKKCNNQTQLHKFYTRKEAMEKAAIRGQASLGLELGGEFPVQDMKTGEGGLLQVCLQGVGLLFANSKFFIRLENIRKCFTQKNGIFVLEEYNRKTKKIIQHTYKSNMADQICYSVLCVFSYIAAGPQDKAYLKK